MTSMTEALAPHKADGCFILKILDYKVEEFNRLVDACKAHYDFLDLRVTTPLIHLPTINKMS